MSDGINSQEANGGLTGAGALDDAIGLPVSGDNEVASDVGNQGVTFEFSAPTQEVQPQPAPQPAPQPVAQSAFAPPQQAPQYDADELQMARNYNELVAIRNQAMQSGDEVGVANANSELAILQSKFHTYQVNKTALATENKVNKLLQENEYQSWLSKNKYDGRMTKALQVKMDTAMSENPTLTKVQAAELALARSITDGTIRVASGGNSKKSTPSQPPLPTTKTSVGDGSVHAYKDTQGVTHRFQSKDAAEAMKRLDAHFNGN